MAVFKCKMCGAQLTVEEGKSIAECEYCGSIQTVTVKKDDVNVNLFNRANNIRMKNDFDKAAEIYEKILDEDDTDAEAHWGLVLCKYGIEYVDDPATKSKVPTCHRTLVESILVDPDYKSALQNADLQQKALYEKEAHQIAEIQKGILEISSKEEPFDIFICYKETDESGKRTLDSSLANDIYYQLTEAGYKVFYAAITLEDKLGSEYEPYIFAALNSAKIMLVVGTKPEYFNAVWVKNEWSRYLALMKKDRSKKLFPCYKDMDPYDLPEEFGHLQGQDMSKMAFIQDLIRNVKKIIVKDEPKPAVETVKEVIREVVKEPSSTGTSSGNAVAPLLQRAFMYLEDGEWENANDYCERVLDADPQNARAYLGKLMVELKCKTEAGLKNCSQPFDDMKNYQKAIRFADAALRDELEGCIRYIRERNEKAAKELADKIKRSLETIQKYESQDEEKQKIAKFQKDIASLESEHRNVVSEIEKIEKQTSGIAGLQEESNALVAKMKGLNESIQTLEREKSRQENRIASLGFFAGKEKKALRAKILEIESEIDRIRTEYSELEYQHSQKSSDIAEVRRLLAQKDTWKNKKNYLESRIEQLKSDLHNFEETYKGVTLSELQECVDFCSRQKGLNLNPQMSWFLNKNRIKLGEKQIEFGHYKQGAEGDIQPIEWIVLDKKDGKALLISKCILDFQKYHSTQNATWDNCNLRSWLNDTFLHSAFSADEQKKIVKTMVAAHSNPKHDTNPGKATQDKVFLLSITEAQKYFKTDLERMSEFTKYARKVAYTVNQWWLRTPGGREFAFGFTGISWVNDKGSIVYTCYCGDSNCGVRPALWVNFES